ncbi:MAG: chemotaxis-specific protein-glutamate methyltransferase CheB [Treponemataceae bacterium]|nr:chemotaxis-specific protein-glutamate methyltransferase CheB [Treponemataceae bacterium]
MIRTLIVDDSAVVRAMLKQVMTNDERFQVVGLAENGEKAVLKAQEQTLDLVIMDYHMPVMDGLEATKEIFSRLPSPPAVVMFSTEQDSAIKNACRRQGVLEYVEKPSLVSMTSEQLRGFCDTLADAVSKKHNYFMLRDSLAGLQPSSPADVTSASSSAVSTILSGYDMVLIGASTGGPDALQTVIRLLGPRFPLPVLITQHIDSQFDRQFVAWLQSTTRCTVTLAKDGEAVTPGHFYVAPADYHMHVAGEQGNYCIRLVQTPPVHFLRPAVDELFLSGANVCRNRCISVLLTGMGRDGADGMDSLKKRGSVTICQNEASCVVFGMPKAAIDMGAATTVLPLTDIPQRIKQLIGFCG